MDDQQLKIRIKLNQIPQPLEPDELEEATDQTKPPFDWQKISAAVLLLVIILCGIFYWWLAEENSSSITESLPAEGAHFEKNDSLILDKKAESGDSIVENKNTASDITTTNTVDILPTAKPVISAVEPTPKPVIEAMPSSYDIIPSKKPETAK